LPTRFKGSPKPVSAFVKSDEVSNFHHPTRSGIVALEFKLMLKKSGGLKTTALDILNSVYKTTITKVLKSLKQDD
jgi:hypothetical protein